MDLQASATGIMITLDEYNQLRQQNRTLKQQNRLLTLQKDEDAQRILKFTSKYDRLLNDSTKRLEEIAKLRQNARELSIRALKSMNQSIKKEEHMQEDLKKRGEEVALVLQQREDLQLKFDELEVETFRMSDELDNQKALHEAALLEQKRLSSVVETLQQQLREREAKATQLQAKLAQARLLDQDAFSEIQSQLRLKEAECNNLKEEVVRLDKDNTTKKQFINQLQGHHSKILQKEEQLLKTYQHCKQRIVAVFDYHSQEHELSNSSIQDQSSMLFRTEPNSRDNIVFSDPIFGKLQHSISSIQSLGKHMRAEKEKVEAKNKQLQLKCAQLNDQLVKVTSQLTKCKQQLVASQSLIKRNEQTIKRLEEVVNEKQIIIKQNNTRIEQLAKQIQQQHTLPHIELKPKGSDKETKNESSEVWKVSSGISLWDSMEKSSILAQKDRLQESLNSQQQKSQILDQENRELRQKYDRCKFQYQKYSKLANELKEKYDRVKAELRRYTEHPNP